MSASKPEAEGSKSRSGSLNPPEMTS
jgi:hypothetical protein